MLGFRAPLEGLHGPGGQTRAETRRGETWAEHLWAGQEASGDQIPREASRVTPIPFPLEGRTRSLPAGCAVLVGRRRD